MVYKIIAHAGNTLNREQLQFITETIGLGTSISAYKVIDAERLTVLDLDGHSLFTAVISAHPTDFSVHDAIRHRRNRI